MIRLRVVPLASAVAFVALLLTSVCTEATQIRYLPVEEMGVAAERVVRGTVTEVRPHWNDARTRILTETTIRVAEDFKGAGPATVRLVQFGGVVDGVRMTVAGSLDWSPGEDVIVFLEPSLPGLYRVSGFNQGKYAVERDPASGREFVRQAGAGSAELVGAPVEGLRARLPLNDLLREALPEREGGR